MMFPCARKLGNICCGHKMFLNKIRNIFVSRTQNLCPQQMLRARENGETFVSATMCPQQCVLVCQYLKYLCNCNNRIINMSSFLLSVAKFVFKSRPKIAVVVPFIFNKKERFFWVLYQSSACYAPPILIVQKIQRLLGQTTFASKNVSSEGVKISLPAPRFDLSLDQPLHKITDKLFKHNTIYPVYLEHLTHWCGRGITAQDS